MYTVHIINIDALRLHALAIMVSFMHPQNLSAKDLTQFGNWKIK